MEVFRSFLPKTSRVPILVSTPHIGLEVHPLRASLKKLSRETFLRDVDYEVQRFWEPACRKHEVGWIGARYHRYNLDLNRPATLNADFVAGHERPGRGDKKGLFWKESTLGEDLFFQALKISEAETLIADLWQPYYDALEQQLQILRKQFGCALLIDGHSMPSQGEKNHSDAGALRADIVPGTLDGRSCPAALAALLNEACTRGGLSCRPNDPYKGGNITQHFCRPHERIYTLQIEVNRKLYMNETSKDLSTDGVARMTQFADDFLAELTSRWASLLLV